MNTPKTPTSGRPHPTGCKVCGESIETGGRGLCQKHYRRFKTKLESFETVDAAVEFEKRCIEEGWALPKQRGGRPKEKDAFDIIAEQVIAEGDEIIKNAVAKRKSVKSRKNSDTRPSKKTGN